MSTFIFSAACCMHLRDKIRFARRRGGAGQDKTVSASMLSAFAFGFWVSAICGGMWLVSSLPSEFCFYFFFCFFCFFFFLFFLFYLFSLLLMLMLLLCPTGVIAKGARPGKVQGFFSSTAAAAVVSWKMFTQGIVKRIMELCWMNLANWEKGSKEKGLTADKTWSKGSWGKNQQVMPVLQLSYR